MDNPTYPAPRAQPSARFVPDRRFTAGAAAGTVVALVVAVAVGDTPGRLLAGIAAVMLGAYVVGDLVYSPRLEARADGLVIRSPFTRAQLGWDDVESIEVVSRLRMGLRNAALEIDAGPVLVEFSRRALGMQVHDALPLVLAFRPPS